MRLALIIMLLSVASTTVADCWYSQPGDPPCCTYDPLPLGARTLEYETRVPINGPDLLPAWQYESGLFYVPQFHPAIGEVLCERAVSSVRRYGTLELVNNYSTPKQFNLRFVGNHGGCVNCGVWGQVSFSGTTTYFPIQESPVLQPGETWLLEYDEISPLSSGGNSFQGALPYHYVGTSVVAFNLHINSTLVVSTTTGTTVPPAWYTHIGSGEFIGQTRFEFMPNLLADVTMDGRVDISDIVQVVMKFGDCADCIEDFSPLDRDGQVSIAEVAAVVIAFGN